MKSLNERLTRRIRTSLYQDQRFTNAELELLHTPSLQRLYDLRQLGFADKVFVDASHTRLSHVLGVMEVATRLCAAISRNLAKHADADLHFRWGEKERSEKIGASELKAALESKVESIRLIALLHDLTHAPFGHTLEDEIKLVRPSHDDPLRQAEAFYQLLVEYLVWSATDLFSQERAALWQRRIGLEKILLGDVGEAREVDIVALGVELLDDRDRMSGRTRVNAEQMAELLVALNFAMGALYHLDISHKFERFKVPAPVESYPANRVIEQILRGCQSNHAARNWRDEEQRARESGRAHKERFTPRRDAFCLDLIGNTICADLLDYAQRDSSHAGLPLSFDVARIIEYFTIIEHEAGELEEKPDHPLHGLALRAAVEFSNSKFRGDVIGELTQLLQVRYYVYERMLFHPTKCVAGAMLGRAVQLLGFKTVPTRWQKTGDAVFLHQLAETGRLLAHVVGQPPPGRYFPAQAREFMDKLPAVDLWPVQAARQALEQRTPSIGSLRDALARDFCGELLVARLAHSKGQVSHRRKEVWEKLAVELEKSEWKDEQALDAALVGRLAQAVAPDVGRDDESESDAARLSGVRGAIEELVPSLEEVASEIGGARRLTGRLNARRYAKRIFCLMPENIEASRIAVTRADVAKRFLDSKLRASAERAIENQAELPRGSVVIHCPPQDGPIKLAKVLVSYLVPENARERGKLPERETAYLRDIGAINGPAGKLFRAHGRHVQSLEEMYASMWRLWVAVAPPDDRKYQELSNIIQEVVAACMFNGGGYASVPNDVFMVVEMSEIYAPEPAERSFSETEQVQPPPPPPPVAVAPDAFLTKEQVWGILQPYFDSLAVPRRDKLLEVLRKHEVIEKIAARSSNPDIRRTLLEREVPRGASTVKWDARDISIFLRYLEKASGVTLDPEHFARSERRRSADEKRDIDKIKSTIAWESSSISSATDGFQLRDYAASLGITVEFRPLMSSGLFAAMADGAHRIFISCEPEHCAQYNRWLQEEEMRLPPQQRFSIAHELVHFLIESKSDLLTASNVRMADITERVCDELAGHMLIPDRQLHGLFQTQILMAPMLEDACKKWGISPHHLIIRFKNDERFQRHPIGYSLTYSWLDGTSKRLRTAQSASNGAMAGPVETLRNRTERDLLPFGDIVSATGHQAAIELRIPASSSDLKREARIHLSMVQHETSSKTEYRLAVARLLES